MSSVQRRGRRIAFDYGTVRIGVAICDPDGILATPLPHLMAKDPKVLTHIKALFDEYSPTLIYIGLPAQLSGEFGASAELVESFIAQLSNITDIPIKRIDERLSTVSASRALREAGKNAKDSKSLIDSMAAVAILESGLSHAD